MFSPRRPASLSRGPFSTPRLAIPERLMAVLADTNPHAGDYLLRLSGLKDGKTEPAGEYEMRIAEK